MTDIYILNTVQNLSITLSTVAPTIFIFGVTLLGNAIEKSLKEEEGAWRNELKEKGIQIQSLQEILKNTKKPGDSSKIDLQIDALKKGTKNTQKKIKQIKRKYDSINLNNLVLKPTAALIYIVFIVGIYNSISINKHQLLIVLGMFVTISLSFGYFVIKIYRSLSLIQEIVKGKNSDEETNKIRQAFRTGLEEYYQSISENLTIAFNGISFPLSIPTSTELSLKFKVKLTKGKIVKDVKIWFFVPDEFGLILPPESDSWRQDQNFSMPNVRTVEIKMGDVSVGPNILGKINLKVPSIPGKYMLKYKIYGEGYVGTIQEAIFFAE